MARRSPLLAHILVALRSSARHKQHHAQPAVSCPRRTVRRRREAEVERTVCADGCGPGQAATRDARGCTLAQRGCTPPLPAARAVRAMRRPRGGPTLQGAAAHARCATYIVPPAAWQMWPFLGWPQMPHLYFERPVELLSPILAIAHARPAPVRSRAAGARPRPAPSVQGGITAAGWRRPAGEHRALEASPAPPRGPALPVAARTRQGLPARCRLPGAERLLVHCACKSQALAGVSNTQ